MPHFPCSDTIVFMNEITPEIARSLTEWFTQNQRILPWRNTGNPYDIWLSEIMLQQTRVEAVIRYFNRFKEELPTIEALASCSMDHLMKLWEGLGYYSRARNLKKCAEILLEKYDGQLPQTKEELLELPGIGSYTAGAVSALAYGKMEPAVDGNVLRVLARLFAVSDDIRKPDTRKKMEEMIESFYRNHGETEVLHNPNFVSQWTQGLMELGAIVCLPNGAPDCIHCPWNGCCKAHLEKQTDEIPYRSALKKRRILKKTVLVIRNGDRFLLHKRSEQGLLARLYEFMTVDGHLNRSAVRKAVEEKGMEVLRIRPLPDARHIFTHQEWHMTGYEVQVSSFSDPHETLFFTTKKELQNYAIPSAFETYLKEYFLR